MPRRLVPDRRVSMRAFPSSPYDYNSRMMQIDGRTRPDYFLRHPLPVDLPSRWCAAASTLAAPQQAEALFMSLTSSLASIYPCYIMNDRCCTCSKMHRRTILEQKLLLILFLAAPSLHVVLIIEALWVVQSKCNKPHFVQLLIDPLPFSVLNLLRFKVLGTLLSNLLS